MDSFDNFQYDSASSYGGLEVSDDTSSVYTANTQDGTSSVDLAGLALSDYNGSSSIPHEHTNHHQHQQARNGLDEDFDAVLDGLKDEGVLDLPPHACRRAATFLFILYSLTLTILVTVASIRQPRLLNALFAPSGFATLEGILPLLIS